MAMLYGPRAMVIDLKSGGHGEKDLHVLVNFSVALARRRMYLRSVVLR